MKQKEMALSTKRELAAALKKLMAVKPINKITVRELVSECGVNRNCFYYHFEDIYALFKRMVEAEAVEIIKQYDLMMDYHEVVNFVLDYVENNQYLLTNAYNAIGQAGLKRFLYLDFVSCLGTLIDQGAHKQGGSWIRITGRLCALFMPRPLPARCWITSFIRRPEAGKRWYPMWSACCAARCRRLFNNKNRARKAIGFSRPVCF